MSSVPKRPSKYPLPLAARQRLWAQIWERIFASMVPETAPEPTPAPSKPKRQRRPKPSRLAKWEAHWQAERAEAES